ncbi:unnamed protein product, partial [Nesidiocoris tenuis]
MIRLVNPHKGTQKNSQRNNTRQKNSPSVPAVGGTSRLYTDAPTDSEEEQMNPRAEEGCLRGGSGAPGPRGGHPEGAERVRIARTNFWRTRRLYMHAIKNKINGFPYDYNDNSTCIRAVLQEPILLRRSSRWPKKLHIKFATMVIYGRPDEPEFSAGLSCRNVLCEE